ncbi:MAG TPA: Wadjet anti-phage system protein JetA family protein [Geomonas sp.]|nr:Wadjet anti-phage system protein JetA family protein [Geomonas sp.]
MLFQKLPDDIFKPLSGPNRHLYEAVLLALYPVFFDENEAEDFFPRRDAVIDEMEEALGRFERLQWVAENQEELEDIEQFPSVPRCADYLYHRLLKTGWLEEDQEGYHKTVIMPPIVSSLLAALISISHNEKKSYGGTVLGILVQIEAAIGNPEDMGQLLIEAVDNTRKFNSHLTGIIYGLKDIQSQIIASRSPREIFASFFDDFVTNILIADYKTLQSENNPFRFRTRILQHLRILQGKYGTAAAIARHYAERYGHSETKSLMMVMDDIQYLVRSFELVDRRLAKIDQFRFRLEERVAETVRYLDKTTPGVRTRIATLLESLGALEVKGAAVLAEFPSPQTLLNHHILSPNSIRITGRRRSALSGQVLREPAVSPEVIAKSRALTQYMARRRATPEKVVAYLERQLAGKEQVDAHEMVIETVEDYVAFTHVKHLARLGAKGYALATRYQVTASAQPCRNRWLECAGFLVTRRR